MIISRHDDLFYAQADKTPDPLFPGLPHNVHRALWTLLNHTGSLSAAGALLAEYALKISQKK